MSYLIALYVFYHGNNLEAFGFAPGSKDIENKNQGMNHRTDEELSEYLHSNVVSQIRHERGVEKLLDYESVFREAMAKSQQETYALMNSSLGFESTNKSEMTTLIDDDGEIDLNFFDGLNGF